MESDGDSSWLRSKGVELFPDETICARLTVNSFQVGKRLGGGHLVVTNRRLVFVPITLAEANGAFRFDIPLNEVTSVDVAPRGWHASDGSWRRRLRVTVRSGDDTFFVSWQPKKAAHLIERARLSAVPR